jgi:hypothetical protein
MHFNIIRSGHTNGRLFTSLLSLYYIACAVTTCLEATIGYIAPDIGRRIRGFMTLQHRHVSL